MNRDAIFMMDTQLFINACIQLQVPPVTALNRPTVLLELIRTYGHRDGDSVEFWRRLHDVRPDILTRMYENLDITDRLEIARYYDGSIYDSLSPDEIYAFCIDSGFVPRKALARSKYVVDCVESYRAGKYDCSLFWELLSVGLSEGELAEIYRNIGVSTRRRINVFARSRLPQPP